MIDFSSAFLTAKLFLTIKVTLTGIFHQFMRETSHLSVKLVVKAMVEMTCLKIISVQFMKGKNHTSVLFVTKLFLARTSLHGT